MELSLKEFISTMRKRSWLILLSIVIICSATVIYRIMFVTPEYKASVEILVNKQNVNSSGVTNLDVSAINSNILLVNSYIKVFKTPYIMDEVAKRLGDPALTEGLLEQRTSISSVVGTQVVTISAVDESYKQAAKIVNTAAQVFAEKIPTAFEIDNITVLNYADSNAEVSAFNTGMTLSLIVAFIVSLILGIGAAVILEFADDRIIDIEDSEKALALPILGVITKARKKDILIDQKIQLRSREHVALQR